MASLDSLIERFRQMRSEAENKRYRNSAFPEDSFIPKGQRADFAKRQAMLEQQGLPGVVKQAAQEMYENPAVNAAIGFTPGAGDLQSAFEAIKAAREGNYGEAGLNALGVLPFIPSMGMVGKTVWHGSPHSFNKFDLTHVGSGEGAQAYGHGVYLADRPEEAMKYQPRDLGFEDKIMKKYQEAEKAGDYASMQVYEDFLTHKSPMEVAESVKEAGFKGKDATNAQKALEHGSKAFHNQTAGSLYKVDLPDEQINKMIDYYKPIKEQPEAYEAFKKYAYETQANPEAALNLLNEHTGAEAYTMWNNPEHVSQFLHEQGIPGIKYPEQKYVAKPNMTPDYNYVVFSDELPQILERNAQPIK